MSANSTYMHISTYYSQTQTGITNVDNTHILIFQKIFAVIQNVKY